MRALLVMTLCAACDINHDTAEGYCPSWLPAEILSPRLTVTEGGTTSFVLSTRPFSNSEGVSVMLDTANHAIATMAPLGFVIYSAHPTSPMLEISGVDDNVAAGDRYTSIDFVFDDCGAGGPEWADITVVDRQSLNVLASEWNLFGSMQGGSMQTFEVVLTQPPPSPVTVTVVGGAFGVTPSSLVFDATTYGVAQTVTVLAGNATSGQILLVPDSGIATRTVQVSSF
jgi:hypothetical protein